MVPKTSSATRPAWPVAAGLAAGAGLDLLVGDPRRAHPVAVFGRAAGSAERLLHRDSRAAGGIYVMVLAAGPGALGWWLGRAARPPAARLAATATATWAVLGGTTLRREALAMARLLEHGDVAAARQRLPHLCGRDAHALGVEQIARATVESVAENTSDAVVGPLVWGTVAGLPGLLAYRAVNTLDAMVGHRSPRYARFGWAAARLDDVANLVPARLTAALAAALAPTVGGRPGAALRAWRRDGRRHPSPNAGPVEAAFAGALGRTLGGRLSYAGRVQDRPLLGEGPAPCVADVRRAERLSAAVQLAAVGLAVAARGAGGRLRR